MSRPLEVNVDRLASMWNHGDSVDRICRRLGCSKAQVYYHVTRLGLQLRAPQHSHPKAARPIPASSVCPGCGYRAPAGGHPGCRQGAA